MSPAQEQLQNLQKVGKLKAEPPNQAEFDGLVRSAKRKLPDAENPALSPTVASFSHTTRPILSPWRPFAGMASVRRHAISFFRFWAKRCPSQQLSGDSWTTATKNEMLRFMTVKILMTSS